MKYSSCYSDYKTDMDYKPSSSFIYAYITRTFWSSSFAYFYFNNSSFSSELTESSVIESYYYYLSLF